MTPREHDVLGEDTTELQGRVPRNDDPASLQTGLDDELDVIVIGKSRNLVQGSPRGVVRDNMGGFIFM